jgi:16S rRNA (cytosine967-C5)-methyltransferase
LVNAVLRRVVGIPDWAQAVAAAPADERAAVETCHPRWLLERWVRAFGDETALAMAEADHAPAPVTLRVNRSSTTRAAVLEALAAAGLEASPGRAAPAAIRLAASGRVDALPGYAAGWWQVQDEAAQLVGDFAEFPAGRPVLDLCAAPGGKACHQGETHPVLAVDVDARKLALLQEERGRLALPNAVDLLASDARTLTPETATPRGALGRFGGVLLDAPCSGTGTLRRHPELLVRRQEADIARLAELQRELLEAAARLTAEGGVLVYAVCSVEPEEGPVQVRRFLDVHAEFELCPPSAFVAWPLVDGALRTLPGPEGFDGFFAARLRRRAA